jgi:hypothetical protein
MIHNVSKQWTMWKRKLFWFIDLCNEKATRKWDTYEKQTNFWLNVALPAKHETELPVNFFILFGNYKQTHY